MRRHNAKGKKRSRRQFQSKAKGIAQNNDESQIKIPESSIKNARIKSAIENGSRIALPSDTQGLNLSKFEHIGKEGPLVVYAEDKKMFNEFGHFSVITSFKPSDSLRNQLFFASKPVSKSLDYERLAENAEIRRKGEKHRKRIKDDVTREATTTSVNSRLSSQKNNSDKVRQTRRQPNSFEDLVKRYKDRQEKYIHLLGDESLYLFQKIDRMCKAGNRDIDTNFPVPQEHYDDSKNPEIEKLVFPRISVHEPGTKKVHIKFPKEDGQLVLKKEREEKLPFI